MKSIIIIGNGPSVLEKEYGDVIDKFDIVVRFNEYVTKKFEKYVGTKTTYWFNSVNFQSKSTESRVHHNYERIILHSWQWDSERDVLFKSFSDFYKNSSVKIIKTHQNLINEIQTYVGDKTYYYYSTGALAIWMLLKEHDKVVITGFDWWKPSTVHHYSDKAPRGKIHDPQKEYVLIKKLIDESKLIML